MELKPLRAVRLPGEDRKGWLQGQLTNDLKKLQPNGAIDSCLCSPTGQIEAILTLWALPDMYMAITDVAGAEMLKRRVEQNVIMEDVRAGLDDGKLMTLQGPEATKLLGSIVELPKLDAGEAEYQGVKIVLLRSNRTGLGGWDIVIPPDGEKAVRALKRKFAPIRPEAFDVARLEAGIPVAGRDTDAKTMPPELGPAFVQTHVNYNKGCYTGQEVLMRIFSRGHVNRKWVGLFTQRQVSEGAVVSHGSRDQAGVVTSSAFSPDMGPIAAAMVRADASERGEIVNVRTADGPVEGEVQPMPLLQLG